MRMALMGAYLPGELINEILLRLPVKSLARFRCVSKQWKSLINDSEFATLHLNRSKKKQTRPHSLVFSTQDDTSIFYKSSFKVGDSKISLSCEHDFKLHGLPSCDGLLCFWTIVYKRGDRQRDFDIPIYLMNPANGEQKKLPPLPMRSYFSHHGHGWVGLGFGAVSRDYKVIVKAVYQYRSGNRQTPHLRSNISVYSLNSNNWTTLEDIQLPDNYMVTHLTQSSAIVINGVAHWMLCSGKMYSFDLVHEVPIELPSLPEFRWYLDLYEMGGNQLSVLCYNPLEIFPQVEMWVMKEIGVREPWIKSGIIHLDYLNIWYSGLENHWNYTPLIGQWNDDEILLQVNGKLVLYNTKNNTKSNLEIDGLPTANFMTVTLTESLVKLVH